MQSPLRVGTILLVMLSVASINVAFGQGDLRRDDRRRDNDRRDYEFGKRRHISRLAGELYDSANALAWEMHNNYTENRGYKRSYQKAYELLQTSKHIRELARGDRRYIRKDDEIEQDLRSSDRLFHDMEGEVSDWRPDSRRRGGNLRSAITRYEDALHHMMDDYGVKSGWDRRQADRYDGRR